MSPRKAPNNVAEFPTAPQSIPEILAPEEELKIEKSKARGEFLMVPPATIAALERRAARYATIASEDLEQEAFECLDVLARIQKKIAASHDPVIAEKKDEVKAEEKKKKRLVDPFVNLEKIIRESLKTWGFRKDEIAEERRRLEAANAPAALPQADEEIPEGPTFAAPDYLEGDEEIPDLGDVPVAAPVSAMGFSPIRTVTSGRYDERPQYEITDMRALCRAVADGLIDVKYVQVNAGEMRKKVNDQKTALNWPGVRVWMDKIPVRT